MAKRRLTNLLALAVLSLLTERPMHPYQISAEMRRRELTAVIKLNQSSLYTLIETLQHEALIVPVETQRAGRYPERTVYQITEVGQSEMLDWLRSLISRPVPEYTPFAAALTFMGHLPPVEVAFLLTERVRHLQHTIDAIQVRLEKGIQIGIDRLFQVEDRYVLAQQTAKLSFVQQLIEEINDGTLTEVRENQRIWKITHPELEFLDDEVED